MLNITGCFLYTSQLLRKTSSQLADVSSRGRTRGTIMYGRRKRVLAVDLRPRECARRHIAVLACFPIMVFAAGIQQRQYCIRVCCESGLSPHLIKRWGNIRSFAADGQSICAPCFSQAAKPRSNRRASLSQYCLIFSSRLMEMPTCCHICVYLHAVCNCLTYHMNGNIKIFICLQYICSVL